MALHSTHDLQAAWGVTPLVTCSDGMLQVGGWVSGWVGGWVGVPGPSPLGMQATHVSGTPVFRMPHAPCRMPHRVHGRAGQE